MNKHAIGRYPGLYYFSKATWTLRLDTASEKYCYPAALSVAPALSDKIHALLAKWDANDPVPLLILGVDFVVEGNMAMLPLPAYYAHDLKSTLGKAIFQRHKPGEIFSHHGREEYREAVVKLLSRTIEILDNCTRYEIEPDVWNAHISNDPDNTQP